MNILSELTKLTRRERQYARVLLVSAPTPASVVLQQTIAHLVVLKASFWQGVYMILPQTELQNSGCRMLGEAIIPAVSSPTPGLGHLASAYPSPFLFAPWEESVRCARVFLTEHQGRQIVASHLRKSASIMPTDAQGVMLLDPSTAGCMLLNE